MTTVVCVMTFPNCLVRVRNEHAYLAVKSHAGSHLRSGFLDLDVPCPVVSSVV